jgi:hypothetical protein
MANSMKKTTISLVASVVVACFAAFFGLIGFLGRGSFAPRVLDELLGLSKYVFSEISKKIDSGYSGTFIFSPNAVNRNSQLIFFAEKGQTAKLTIKASSLGSKQSKIRLFIDNTPWGATREIPMDVVHGDITEKLKFDEPGAGLHYIKVIPDQLEKDALVLVDCLVLVYNK